MRQAAHARSTGKHEHGQACDDGRWGKLVEVDGGGAGQRGRSGQGDDSVSCGRGELVENEWD
ncbi:hypothetical protein ACXZ66_14070 (plasmid) [Corynebacterium sp. S7]